MDLVSKARELGIEISKSDKFIEYKNLYNQVYKDEKNKEMIDDFRKKVVDYQLNYANKGKESEEELKKLENLQNIMMMNQDLGKFLIAETNFSIELKDIYEAIEKELELE
ncbi:YlbF family regulator [Miniphocaeibacter halophilus]|uniref:YlbF family regulator n=1 Tax=Miniphocaeibacter halophilus TaxID=2931922 RepID=A0AC61MQ20_9FIRM|nr:YlbF family regulator [Miniphocaeibacter halophilus]QQK07592.1 YlbF family regulator [Miniphocaeibacter halophilus]